MTTHRTRHKVAIKETASHRQHPRIPRKGKPEKESADVLPFSNPYSMTRQPAWPLANWPMFTWPLHMMNMVMDALQAHRHALTCPKTESYENKDSYFYTAQLPGIKRDDIALAIRNHSIVMSVDQTSHAIKPGCPVKHSLQRSFPIPIKTDGKHIAAHFKDGLLTIAIPKSDHHIETVSDAIPIH